MRQADGTNVWMKPLGDMLEIPLWLPRTEAHGRWLNPRWIGLRCDPVDFTPRPQSLRLEDLLESKKTRSLAANKKAPPG